APQPESPGSEDSRVRSGLLRGRHRQRAAQRPRHRPVYRGLAPQGRAGQTGAGGEPGQRLSKVRRSAGGRFPSRPRRPLDSRGVDTAFRSRGAGRDSDGHSGGEARRSRDRLAVAHRHAARVPALPRPGVSGRGDLSRCRRGPVVLRGDEGRAATGGRPPALRATEEAMIYLKQITLREIRLPLKEPFQISSGTQTGRRIFLLHLRDGDASETWAECVAPEFPNYTSETIDTAWLAIREWVAPRVLGVSFPAPDAIRMVLDKNFRGHNMAKAGVEMGCWGLAATIQEVSLSNLLKGTRERIATGISIGIQPSPGDLVEKARAAANAGYRKIKLKIKPGSDVEFVRAVRQALPDAPR